MILKIQFAFMSAPYWKPFFCLIFFVDVFFSFFFRKLMKVLSMSKLSFWKVVKKY